MGAENGGAQNSPHASCALPVRAAVPLWLTPIQYSCAAPQARSFGLPVFFTAELNKAYFSQYSCLFKLSPLRRACPLHAQSMYPHTFTTVHSQSA